MTSLPVAHIAGMPLEETLASLTPALVLTFGAAFAMLRARLARSPARRRPVRGGRARSSTPDGGPRSEAAEKVSNGGDAGVAGPFACEDVFGPPDGVVAVEIVAAVDVGPGREQDAHGLERAEGRGEVQWAAALVGAGVGIGAALEQPRDRGGTFVVRCVYERFVEHVLSHLARR